MSTLISPGHMITPGSPYTHQIIQADERLHPTFAAVSADIVGCTYDTIIDGVPHNDFPLKIFRKAAVSGVSYDVSCDVDTFIFQRDSKGRWRQVFYWIVTGSYTRESNKLCSEPAFNGFVSVSDSELVIATVEDSFEITRMKK